jgi:hypothetical protein
MFPPSTQVLMNSGVGIRPVCVAELLAEADRGAFMLTPARRRPVQIGYRSIDIGHVGNGRYRMLSARPCHCSAPEGCTVRRVVKLRLGHMTGSTLIAEQNTPALDPGTDRVCN